MRGVWRIRQHLKRQWIRFHKRAIILLYHRVAEIDSDPQLLCVSPRTFEEHLRILRHNYHPLPLQALSHNDVLSDLPERAVIITFDDGYADNLHQAGPLLKKYDIPATIFVTTGLLDYDGEFWWDELEKIFLQPGYLPTDLSLRIAQTTYSWNLKDWAIYSRTDYTAHASWTVLNPQFPTLRHQIYHQLCHILMPLSPAHRQELLQDLRAWSGRYQFSRPTHRHLTRDEVQTLAKDACFDIGAHCIEHPMLSTVSIQEQRREILQGKTQLETVLNHPLHSFAYPYGKRGDYTADTVEIVRQAGFSCACSNFPDVILASTDILQLPRYCVRDWSGDQFSKYLKTWLVL